MSNNEQNIVTDRKELIEWFASGCKPMQSWRIGTEHEKFIFSSCTSEQSCVNKRLPYHGESSIHALLKGLCASNWEPIYEEDFIIGLVGSNGDSITLEPGGQFELSGAPLENIHQTCNEIHVHLDNVKRVCSDIKATAIGLGFDPFSKREDVPLMPKNRYKIMRRYMPTKGQLGLDMMLRTCTVQVNLDFSSEADLRRKMQVSTALQPLSVALFANSPFIEGKPSGFKSSRAHCWTDTDPDRCGVPNMVFSNAFGFESWTDFVLNVPMYFIKRKGIYHDVAGLSFKDFMAGKLKGFEGQYPTIQDWSEHVTTVFTDVRIKQYIEMRGADGGAWGNLCALPAFWTGLLYDGVALDEAAALIGEWDKTHLPRLTQDAARQGLDAMINGRSLQDYGRDVIAIAKRGLKRRARFNHNGFDETNFLDLLEEIAFTGETLADRLLDYYKNRWNGDASYILSQSAY